ncbi:VOC family protein [Mesorhizobium microcysteis]|uniref:VOC family protein n=1 Tax=Neoaquamicrobium microcysteis TaxID=2682781 RepID=A0A5D4GPE2_9HYPH|nr:VOC family protein [Mesorhizobium microcysteis]TYR29793.1 VOC family protein [Mesorhizobium microcysteis]
MTTNFEGGRNIALKVPPHQYDDTVRFYRETLGLRMIEGHEPAVGFHFGANQLWIDRMPGMSQAELWLEIVTDDMDTAAAHLEQAAVVRCDEIEPLGPNFRGFWVSSPSSIIHLVDEKAGAW